jgi:hypothetical protein
MIARVRGVSEENILTGAGSSDLIFAALRGWITPSSRVLILDPMYGEYAYVLERVFGARVDRFTLGRANGYQVEPDRLADALARAYDWVIVVNPNSPTGRHVPQHQLEHIIGAAPTTTRFWIDETYVEFVGEDQSLEAYAAASATVVVVESVCAVWCASRVSVWRPSPTSLRRGTGAPHGQSVSLGRSACEALAWPGLLSQPLARNHRPSWGITSRSLIARMGRRAQLREFLALSPAALGPRREAIRRRASKAWTVHQRRRRHGERPW